MTIEEIRELIELVNETGVAELEVERGGNRVRICSRSSFGTQYIVPPQMAPQMAHQMGMAAPAPAASAAAAPPPRVEPAPAKPENLTLVKSPIVGTFYE